MTGAHHARELTSIQMNMYMLLKLIYNYQKNKSHAKQIIDNNWIFILPVVNVDGFIKISDYFKTHGRIEEIRKN